MLSDSAACSSGCLTGPDSDCDGIADSCDLCPGGEDSIDNNGDGLPDCYYFPGVEHLSESWSCKVPSGAYLVRLQTGTETVVRRLVVVQD